MDSWPAWVRWLAVLAIIAATALWFVYGWTWAWARFPQFPFWIPWSIWTAVFLWVCVATAPRFKLLVALLLGLVSLPVASYIFDPLRSYWAHSRNTFGFFMFLLMPNSQPYLIGLIITWGLAVGGFLQRRRVRFSKFWFAGAVALFTALSVANYLVFLNTFEALAIRSSDRLTPDFVNAMVYGFIGREIVLTVVAIGGVWALYFFDKRRRFDASCRSAQ
jgi:hypothetical protein